MTLLIFSQASLTCSNPRPTVVPVAPAPPCAPLHLGRRAALASVLLLTGVSARGAQAAGKRGVRQGLELPSAAPAAPAEPAAVAAPSRGISIVPVDAAVVAKMRERDENMAFKCSGGMFDCDGDRRDFAKKQYANFLSRNK